jgi:hypothetical protein
VAAITQAQASTSTSGEWRYDEKTKGEGLIPEWFIDLTFKLLPSKLELLMKHVSKLLNILKN